MIGQSKKGSRVRVYVECRMQERERAEIDVVHRLKDASAMIFEGVESQYTNS